MRAFLSGVMSFGASLALTGAAAFAADMPYRSPPPRFIPPPVISWTGLHFGVNAGGSWGISPFITPAQDVAMLRVGPPIEQAIAVTAATAASPRLSANNNGFVGGAQIGYDWQAGSSVVIGVEADAQGFSRIRSRSSAALLLDVPDGGGFQIGAFTQGSRSLNFLGTVRLRAGYLAMPTLLVYATGGFAYGSVSGDYGVTQAYFPPPMAPFATTAWTGQGAYSKIGTGWAAGFGWDWMIYPGVSIRGEYLYYALGSVATPGILQRDPTGIMLGPAWQSFTTSYTRYNGHIFRAGLNIHFGDYGPLAPPVKGPIYARY